MKYHPACSLVHGFGSAGRGMSRSAGHGGAGIPTGGLHANAIEPNTKKNRRKVRTPVQTFNPSIFRIMPPPSRFCTLFSPLPVSTTLFTAIDMPGLMLYFRHITTFSHRDNTIPARVATKSKSPAGLRHIPVPDSFRPTLIVKRYREFPWDHTAGDDSGRWCFPMVPATYPSGDGGRASGHQGHRQRRIDIENDDRRPHPDPNRRDPVHAHGTFFRRVEEDADIVCTVALNLVDHVQDAGSRVHLDRPGMTRGSRQPCVPVVLAADDPARSLRVEPGAPRERPDPQRKGPSIAD